MGKSLTVKLNNSRLKDALRRRAAARAITHLYDHSVPTEMRFHGVSFANRVPGKPAIRVADALSLSPYIIHLNAHLPTPQEWLAADTLLPAPNLLVPDAFFLSLTDAERLNPADDLALSPLDTIGQIREDVPIGQKENRGASSSRKEQDGRTVLFAGHPEELRGRFAPEPFVPPVAPANLASYFELPEEDGETDEGEAILTFTESTITSAEDEQATAYQSINSHFRDTISRIKNVSWLPLGWHRTVGVFVLACLVFTLPLHAISLVTGLEQARSGIETSSSSALAQLQAGADAVLVRDASAASDSFDGANRAFSQAQQSVNDLGSVTSLLLSAVPATGSTYRAGTKLLKAGSSLSAAGERIADGVLAAQNEPSPTPVSRLRLLEAYVSSALPDLKASAELVADVDASDVPEAQRAAFAELAARLPVLVASVEEFTSFSAMAETVLGGNGAKRYLLVFQNNAEIRATGGFMGSFAELDLKDGVITSMSVPGGGTYDLQGSLKHNVAAPEPLQLLNARWEFQDANWFPDFPTSARQMMDFYTDAGGGSVDGVIAVNATCVADLIGLLGPVDMPEYGRTITGENFVTETETIVEREYDKTENKPKAFIGDLAATLLSRIMDNGPENFLTALDRANQGLQSRDIQIYFSDSDLERSVRDLGWGGEIKSTDNDYLMLVDTNLGGGKTDGVIEEEANVVVNVDVQGGITNTVTVTRTHNGKLGDLLTGVNNVDYVRLYVPQGSTLLSADGFTVPDASLFEIPPDDWVVDDDLLYSMDSLSQDLESKTAVYREFGKTVFGNWVQTKPGTSTTYSFSYRLPFTLQDAEGASFLSFMRRAFGLPSAKEYSLTIQKQSGAIDRTTHVSIRVPNSLVPAWTSQNIENATIGNASDTFIGALFNDEGQK